MTAPAPGSAVMMAARGRFPRVAHQLARIKAKTVLYPFVMACGYATTRVEPASDDLARCGKCWA